MNSKALLGGLCAIALLAGAPALAQETQQAGGTSTTGTGISSGTTSASTQSDETLGHKHKRKHKKNKTPKGGGGGGGGKSAPRPHPSQLSGTTSGSSAVPNTLPDNDQPRVP